MNQHNMKHFVETMIVWLKARRSILQRPIPIKHNVKGSNKKNQMDKMKDKKRKDKAFF
jgi:hypothetical protein